MIWKKDRLRPSQPYFVIDTEQFQQEIYLRQGISHFYSFHMEEERPLRIVPDGCIDLFFEYQEGRMQGFACGTSLDYSIEETQSRKDVFGVRFMPGMQPEMLNVTMRELLKCRIPLEKIVPESSDWLKRMEQEHDFYQRIRVFIEYYTMTEKNRSKPYGKKELVQSIKQMVYDSEGKVKVGEMQEQSGYSERYINKVFLEEMGFSPKTFCKIIQFQHALEFLNYGTPEHMTDTAVALGYYDQSQFIRDFTKYAGLTPKKYLRMIQERCYINRIQDTDFFSGEI